MGANNFYSLDGPLDSMPGSRQMRIANLSGFGPMVRRLGADPVSLLERHGIDPLSMRDPEHFIDCQSFVDLFEYCSSALNNPLFGLQLAQQQDPDVFGCVAALCRAASTVREAVSSFIEFIPVTHAPDVILQLVEGSETAEIRWSVGTDLGLNKQANYQAALLDVKLLRLIGGSAFRPSYVNLAVDASRREVAELERQLGCRFNTRAPQSAIAFPVQILDQPVPSANRLVFKLLGGYLEQVKHAARTSIQQRVDDYVRGSLSSGNCTIERCAGKLGMSVRTLQAHLGDAGLNFSDMLEKQRVDAARAYLDQAQLSLDDVAAMLGYAEQSSFGRAFKRWTGMTPRHYRQTACNRTALANGLGRRNDMP
ncbi:MAG: AraC family transcriptional regulator ligand-binding domain-containing protein [Haliea sp.]|nr:AraC family transcriptional regulator ligand-binding domain-containing protein [Haliea sp.]